ncbi:MAG: hypothetical protein DHS20C20_20030 [Ardenticatenaceae bacterium]|nr:MAG: hypothetical protein DHS20C20_20030 [Ardenticatenaceae bacterium]
MQQRRFIVGGLILFFFVITGGLTSCALFESASETDLTNAVGMSSENDPGSGQWVPPVPKNRNQCLQLHSIGVTLKENMDSNVVEMEIIRDRCVDANGAFLPGVDQAECIQRYDQFFVPAELQLADLIVGGNRYGENCTTNDEDNTLPAWPHAEGEKDEEEAPKATAVPEATKVPETGGSSGGSTCCWCLTCTQRLDTGYIFRPIIIQPKG